MAIESDSQSLHMTLQLPVPPEEIYTAWIDSIGHRDITGGNAHIDPRQGGNFSAWDGYISGILLKLEPNKRIVQSWRTTDFHPLDPSSMVEILLEANENGTLLTLKQTELPKGQAEKYKQGWQEFYFVPMLGYFTIKAEAVKSDSNQRSVTDETVRDQD